MMYTKTAIKYIASSMQINDFWGSLPFAWDKKTKKVVMVNTLRRKISWYCNIAAHTIFETWQLFMLFRASFNPETTPTQQIYHETMCVAYMIPVVVHLSIALRLNEFYCCIHQTETFFNRCGRKYVIPLESGKERPNGCEKLQWLFNFFRVAMNWGLFVLQFLRPGRPVFVSSMIPNAKNLQKWQITPFAIIQSYLLWTFWGVMFFVVMPLLPAIFGWLTTLQELTISTTPTKRITRGSMRLSRNRAVVYRELQVLLTTINDCCRYVIPGHKILFILLAIRSLYMMVKFPGLPRILSFIMVGGLWIYLSLMFTLIARYYEYSKETLFSWRNRFGEGPWFRKFHRSCQPTKVEVGGFYYVDYGIVITMFTIIIDYSVNMLLTY